MKEIFKNCLIVLGIAIGAIALAAGITFLGAVRYSGVWQTEGYGFCFEVTGAIVKAYSVTESYYTREKSYDGVIIGDTLYCGLGKFRIEIEDNALHMIDQGSRTTYVMSRQNNDCFEKLFLVTKECQAAKLQMFYETLQENYAFADLYGVDFKEEYKKSSSLINDQSSEEEVYQAMCDMVAKLDDGHVEIKLGDQSYCPSDYLPYWMENIKMAQQLVNVIKEKYLKNYYRFKDCYIRYGTLKPDMGYVIIQGIGVTKLDKSRTTREAMNRVIREFQDMDKIILDLRFSPGGYDEAALTIAGYFTDKEYLTYKKQTYHHGVFTDLQSVYVKPEKEYYKGELIILTSGYTISAAETLIRDILANPNREVTVIGEKTAGYYSDAIPKVLPGGIEFTMSMERYYWYDNTMLEGRGIEPQMVIPFDYEAIQEGKDPVLDYVLEN